MRVLEGKLYLSQSEHRARSVDQLRCTYEAVRRAASFQSLHGRLYVLDMRQALEGQALQLFSLKYANVAFL